MMDEAFSVGGRSEPIDTSDQACALLATYYTSNYKRLVRLVHSRFSSLDGQDAVQDLYCKILTGVEACEAAGLTAYVHRWTQHAFVAKSLINACLDLVGSSTQQREEVRDFALDDSTPGPRGRKPLSGGSDPAAPPAEPEGVLDQMSALCHQTAVRTMVRVLYERGQRPTTQLPYLTERQLETLVTVYGGADTLNDGGPLNDDQLHDHIVRSNRRARERWRDQHGRSDPESGSVSKAASRLGVSRQAVSKSLQSCGVSMVLLHYIAGVLAPDRTLLDVEAVHRHADGWDEVDLQTGRQDRRRLRAAATAVRTTVTTGTRVQPELLKPIDNESPDESLTGLHEAERSLAEHNRSAHPNCVLVCDDHTECRDRVTEVYL